MVFLILRTKVFHAFEKKKEEKGQKKNTAKSLNEQARLKESKSPSTSANKHQFPTRFDQKHTNQKQLMV